MNKIGKARLLELAAHLESKARGHKKFDLCFWNRNPADPYGLRSTSCGSSGCAIGELPIIHPERFEFEFNEVRDKRNHAIDGFLLAEIWFHITTTEALLLFSPRRTGKPMSAWGVVQCGRKATAKQVAANIRTFVACNSTKSAKKVKA